MPKLPLYIILTGILLVVSSCVPVARDLYRLAQEPAERFDLLPGRPLSVQVPVAADEALALSLALDLEVGEHAVYAVRYSYELKAGGQSLQHGSGVINQQRAGVREKRVRRGASERVVRRFPIVGAERPAGPVVLDVAIDGPEGDDAVLVAAQASVRYDPPGSRVSFIGLALIWTLGILLVLIGAIQWVRGIAATPGRVGTGLHPDTENARVWCMLCHLGALAGYLVPFGHIVVPALVWRSRRDRVPGVDAAGRESLNFQLTVTLFVLIGVLLSVVFVGLVLIFAVVVFHVVMTLRASLRAQRGLAVVYPMNIRLIKE